MADPDPWRNRLRATFGWPLPLTMATLKRQADDVVPLQKQPPASLVLLASLLKLVGETERSTAVLQIAWQRFPGDFWVNHRLGMSPWSQGRFAGPEEALRFSTAAVAARPYSAPAHANLGLALAGNGKVEEAIACYHKAIELDPKLAHAQYHLGYALYRKGKPDAAITCWKKAIALDPRFAWAHFNLGTALAGKGQLDAAIACWKKAIALDPKLASAHFNLGLALKQQGKFDEAIASYRNAIEVDPSNVNARNELGLALGR